MATSDTLTSLPLNLAALAARPVAPGLAVDPFTGNDVAVKPWISNSSGSNVLGLTARGTIAPSTDGLPGFATAIDAEGQGTLRLTAAGGNQSSFAIFNQAISRNLGLSITFDFFSYGGSGADGISFFLIDGSASPTTPGAFGGALGYAARGATSGLQGGYLGIGFDEFGNFSSTTDNSPGGIGPGATQDSIAVRGSQANSYRYLTGTSTLPTSLDVSGASATRTAARRTARIDLSPTGNLNVQIDLNADGDFLDGGETPAALQNYNVVDNNGALPDNFKFGFAASTGGATNIHEIRGLSIGASGQLIGGLAGTSYTSFQPPIVLASDLTVSGTAGNLTAATVLITNFKPGDTLGVAGQPTTATSGKIGTLDWTFDPTTGELGLDGTGTAAEYQAALRQITYRNSNGTPDTEVRNVRFRLDSLAGGPANELPVQVSMAPRQPDLVLRDSVVNDVVAWYLQGSTLTQANQISPFLEPAWAIVDSEDFNADGRADLLLRNDPSGEVVIWYMGDNGAILPGSGYITAPGTPASQVTNGTASLKLRDGWQLVGAANVDGDAALELVWQNRSTDEYGFWNIDTATNNFVSSDYFRDGAGSILKTGNNWEVVGLADFNQTGRTDLLLRLATLDQTAYWQFNVDAASNQVRLATAAFLPATGNTDDTLRVRAIADFTGEGRPDILWRKTDEDVTILWTIGFDPIANQLSATPSTLPATNLVSWTIGGADDFVGNGLAPDGTADIVWRNGEFDQVAIWSIKNGQLDAPNTDFVKFTNGSLAQTGRSSWDVEEANQFGVGTDLGVSLNG